MTDAEPAANGTAPDAGLNQPWGNKTGAARSALIFWLFLAAHTALWTLVPSLRNHNFPLDVVEHLAWGREWEFGYHKHPPMASWLLEAAATLFGRSEFVIYGLSQACIAIAFIAIWMLARSMLAPLPALGAVLLGEGVIYHSFTSPEFNVNVASLPFWAVSLAVSHRLFVSAPEAQHKPAWIVLGLAMGGAVLAKYTAGLLGICILALMLMPPAWHWWRKPGPYLALGFFGLAVLPHVLWLFLHGFPTFTYALARGDTGMAGTAGALDHLAAPAGFLAAQLPAIAPALVLTALAWPWRPRWPRPTDRQDLFLLIMGLGPLLVLMLLALIFAFDLKAMWGTTLFLTLGLMIVRWLQPAAGPRPATGHPPATGHLPAASPAPAALRRGTAGLAVVLLLGPLIYLAEPAVANGLLKRTKRTQFPGPELAQVLETRWRAHFGTPLAIVAGDEWLAGNVSIYAPDRPSVFLNADPAQAPWIRPGAIAESGALVVWMADKRGSVPVALAETNLAGLAAQYPSLIEQPPLTLPWAAHNQHSPVTVGWAIIPPQTDDEISSGDSTDMK